MIDGGILRECYESHLYYVEAYRYKGHIRQIMIRRHDWGPVFDWRDIQAIKNRIAGPEAEAIELFPAESRVVDNQNWRHLWLNDNGEKFVWPNANGEQFLLGWKEASRCEDATGHTQRPLRQRSDTSLLRPVKLQQGGWTALRRLFHIDATMRLRPSLTFVWADLAKLSVLILSSEFPGPLAASDSSSRGAGIGQRHDWPERHQAT